MNRLSKLLILFLCAALLFAGCSAPNTAEVPLQEVTSITTSVEKSSVQNEPQTESQSVSAKDNTKKAETEKEKSTHKAGTKYSGSATKKSAENKKTTSKKENSAAPSSERNTQSQTERQNVQTEQTTKAVTVPSGKGDITCTVGIECMSVLDHMDKLKAGHAVYIPSDGIILEKYTLTIPSASTAYDALERACSDNNIKLSVQKTGFGVYISGINNIDEKDCGSQSGWIYSVNGVKPPKSVGQYKLNNGDKLVFSYTC